MLWFGRDLFALVWKGSLSIVSGVDVIWGYSSLCTF